MTILKDTGNKGAVLSHSVFQLGTLRPKTAVRDTVF